MNLNRIIELLQTAAARQGGDTVVSRVDLILPRVRTQGHLIVASTDENGVVSQVTYPLAALEDPKG